MLRQNRWERPKIVDNRDAVNPRGRGNVDNQDWDLAFGVIGRDFAEGGMTEGIGRRGMGHTGE